MVARVQGGVVTDHPASVASTAAVQIGYVISTQYEYTYMLNSNTQIVGGTNLSSIAVPYTVIPAGTVPAAESTT